MAGAYQTFVVTCRNGLIFEIEARDLREARDTAYDYNMVKKFGLPLKVRPKAEGTHVPSSIYRGSAELPSADK